MSRAAPALAPTSAPTDEAEAVRAVLAGDRNAYRLLVERHQARLFNLCLRLLASRSDAEDAAQEAFVRAYRALDRYDPARPFLGWLIEIAVNVCRDRRRTAWWRRVLLGDASLPPPDVVDPIDASDRADALKALVAGLAELRPADREALALLVEEIPAAEAARTLGITPNALYVRQCRARTRLATILRERHPELFDDRPEGV